MVEDLDNLFLLFIGAVGIGFVSAITGIGGGSLMVPFMVLILDYDVKVAIAVSLLCVVVTSSTAASTYLRKGLVDLKTALLLEPSTALGAIIGAHITLALPVRVVKGALGLLLIWISIMMLRRALKGMPQGRIVINLPNRKLLAVLSSFFAGISSGMFGIGGGVIKVPVMTLLMGLPIKTAVATSSFMVGLTATSGGIVYLAEGYIDPPSVLALALGIIPGATLGARAIGRIKSKLVLLSFVAVLMFAALRLLYTVIT